MLLSWRFTVELGEKQHELSCHWVPEQRDLYWPQLESRQHTAGHERSMVCSSEHKPDRDRVDIREIREDFFS